MKPVQDAGHQDGAGSAPAGPFGSFPLQHARLHGEEEARNLISLTRRSLTVGPISPLPIHLLVFKTVNNGWLWYTSYLVQRHRFWGNLESVWDVCPIAALQTQ